MWKHRKMTNKNVTPGISHSGPLLSYSMGDMAIPRTQKIAGEIAGKW